MCRIFNADRDIFMQILLEKTLDISQMSDIVARDFLIYQLGGFFCFTPRDHTWGVELSFVTPIGFYREFRNTVGFL